jgi:uncharacterized protein (DUF885 family)
MRRAPELKRGLSVTARAKLADLAERYWRFECAESPFSAVLAGAPTEAVKLFREAEEDYARRYAAAADFLAELDGIPGDALKGHDQVSHALLRHELMGQRERFEVEAHLRPWLLPVGPEFNAVYFANATSITTPREAELYLERLAHNPAFLGDVRATLLSGFSKGIRYPRVVLEGAIRNARGMAAAAIEQSPWFGPFKRSGAREKVAAHAARAAALIEKDLLPSLRAYADFLEGTLLQGARETLSCVDAPGGEQYYRYFVRHFTTTNATPDEIHELGLAEVVRLNRDLAVVAADAGFGGDLAGYRRFLVNDPQFVAGSKEELRTTLESLCKRVDLKIPAFFSRIPRITYGVDLIPEALAANLPPAYAQPSPGDGSSAGVFWASSIVSKCPSYMHVPLVVHEAWPGHLMHIALMHELTELPAFRRHGAVKYTACVEGWALYCEGLADEMGLYVTPHQRYGRLEMEMWRAVRLVVDTGIHWKGWSRAQSIAYAREHLALDEATITGEVDRYAALPAQALAYQLGNLKFRSLRQRAEKTLGDGFTHRAFHEAVMMAGAVTLPVLEQVVEDWLARASAPAAA